MQKRKSWGWLRKRLINPLIGGKDHSVRPSPSGTCFSCHLAKPAGKLPCRPLPSACSSHPASIQKHGLFEPSVQISLALPLEDDQVSAACFGHRDPPVGGRAIRETGCQTTVQITETKAFTTLKADQQLLLRSSGSGHTHARTVPQRQNQIIVYTHNEQFCQ